MIFYDGREWRDPEELLHVAGLESQEKYDEVSYILAKEGYNI